MGLRSVKNSRSLTVEGKARALATTQQSVRSNVDVWLQRGSQLAQIGGVALALFGLYYTVIPLYQKAAVDEQLARREIELREVEKGLVTARQEAYELRRDRLMLRVSSMLADDCSQFREAVLSRKEEESSASQRERLLDLSVNVEECVSAGLNSTAISETLNIEDLAELREHGARISRDLEKERQLTIRLIEELPQTGRADQNLLQPIGRFMTEAYALQDRYGAVLSRPFDRDAESRLIYRINITQEHHAREFRLQVSIRLRSDLKPKSWKVVTHREKG